VFYDISKIRGVSSAISGDNRKSTAPRQTGNALNVYSMQQMSGNVKGNGEGFHLHRRTAAPPIGEAFLRAITLLAQARKPNEFSIFTKYMVFRPLQIAFFCYNIDKQMF
jgi:hypothetical protein